MITINSFGTELSKDDRFKLFPTCGKLNPEGLAVLAKADEYDQVKAVADYYAVSDWQQTGEKIVEGMHRGWKESKKISVHYSYTDFKLVLQSNGKNMLVQELCTTFSTVKIDVTEFHIEIQRFKALGNIFSFWLFI